MRDVTNNKLKPPIKKVGQRRSSPEALPDPKQLDIVAIPSSRSDPEYVHIVSMRLTDEIITTLHNAVKSAKDAGNYRFQSASDIIREAFDAYCRGMPLTVSMDTGIKKRGTSCAMTVYLKERYEQLPSRSRSEIIEKAIRTYIKNGLSWNPEK